jgi:choline dehydrogenase-like flavoprotein
MAHPFVQADENTRSYHSGATGRVNQQHVGTIVFDPVDYATYAPEAFKNVKEKMAEAGDPDKRTFTFATGKYRPPFRVSVRTSVDWNVDHFGIFKDGEWQFILQGPQYLEKDLQMKLVLSRITGGIFWMEGHNIELPPEQTHRHLTETDVFFAYKFRYHTKLWQPNHLVTLRTDENGWGRDLYGVFQSGVWTFLLDRANYSDSFAAKLVLDRHQFMNEGDFSITAAKASYEIKDSAEVPSAGTDFYISFPGTPSAYVHGYDNFTALETPLEQMTIRSAGNEEEEYDVIVIGSGMGGGIVANALSDRGARTLVLDAGGLWFPLQINELPGVDVDLARRDELGHFDNLHGSSLMFGVQFNLGGRSVYWSGVIPRMRPWEMREKWPQSVSDYLFPPGKGRDSGYDRAEKLMRKCKTLGPFQDRLREYLSEELSPEFDVLDLPRSLHQPNLDDDGQIGNVLEKPTGVFSTSDLLLDSLGSSSRAGRMNLRINLHHLVTEIEKEDGRVTGVVCQDLIGKVERRYRAWYIILACGSLESAKLALNSGLTDASGKMGKGLTDHPAYFYKRHHALSQKGPNGWIGNPRGHAKLLIQHRAANPNEHAYNIELLVNPKYWDARHADDNVWAEISENNKVSKVEIKFIFGSELVDGNFIKPKGPGKKPDVFVGSNYTGNPFQQEVVDVRNRILRALHVSDSLTEKWVDDDWSRLVQGTVHHAGGTLRMSDDNSGVVDENLKFRAYDNLYCCDVSVFPTIPAANPSLTLAALALRLADTLAGRLVLEE